MVLYVWTYICVARDQKWCQQQEQDSSTHDPTDIDGPHQMMPLPQIDIIVPTGAMGNMVAGYMCKMMGIPIRKIIAACNVNDITHQTIQYGTFHRSEHMQRTLSEAINIQVPYNFERMLYYLTNQNDVLVKEYYHQLATTNRMDLSSTVLQQLQTVLDSARVTDEQMCAAAQAIYQQYQYIADPHTAVAFSAAYQLQYLPPPQKIPRSSTPLHRSVSSTTTTTTIHTAAAAEVTTTDTDHNTHAAATTDVVSAATAAQAVVILATASPCKFEHAVSTALGTSVWEDYVQSDQFPERARRIMNLPEQPYIHYYRNSNINSNCDDDDDDDDTQPLSEIQTKWEQRTLELITQLEMKGKAAISEPSK
jgi:threonine synthase